MLDTILPKSMKVISNIIIIHQQIKQIIQDSLPVKVGIKALYLYIKNKPEENEQQYKAYCRPKTAPYRPILESTDINKVIDDMIHQLDDQIENFDSSRFAGYGGFLLYTAKYNPIGGGSYI